jgi:hypothetical protein
MYRHDFAVRLERYMIPAALVICAAGLVVLTLVLTVKS